MTSTNTTDTARERVDALLAPVVAEGKRVGQQRAAQALVAILDKAEKTGLPVIGWQIGPGAMLMGRLDPLDHGNSERMVKLAWGRWAKVLKLERCGEVRKSGGGMHFYGVSEQWRPRKNSALRPVQVVVTADTFTL